MLLGDLEEYRGEDSNILLPQHRTQNIYWPENRLCADSDYEGTTLRFATIEWLDRILQQITKGASVKTVEYWKDFIFRCLRICEKKAVREKMFLTGSHKTKIKIWQSLIGFSSFILEYFGD